MKFRKFLFSFWAALFWNSLVIAGVVDLSSLAEFRSGAEVLFPSAVEFRAGDAGCYVVADQSGKELGHLYLDIRDTASWQRGFAGPIPVAIATDCSGKVLGVLLGGNDETPSFIQKVRKSGFLGRWNGVPVVKAASMRVDTVTGATRSSSAIKSGVQSILRREAKKAGVVVSAEVAKPVVLSAEEVKRLTARRDMLRKNVVFCQDLIKQWKKQEGDELSVRFVYAVEGQEAGDTLAKARGVRMFTHGKKELTPEQKKLVESYKKAPTAANKAALEKNLSGEIARLKRAVVVHMHEFERSADLIDSQLKAAAPKKVRTGAMRFRSPEAKALEAKIQALAMACRKAPTAENEKALRVALKEQLTMGLSGMGKYVERREAELKALKATYDGIKSNPQKAVEKRFDELTAKKGCGCCRH